MCLGCLRCLTVAGLLTVPGCLVPGLSKVPLVAEGRAYFQNDAGETFVVVPGEKLNLVAHSKLDSESDELFRSAIVPSQGQLLIRSTRHLYCIGAAVSVGGPK